jgi:hypothetical protein
MAMHQKPSHVSAWGDDIKQHNRWQYATKPTSKPNPLRETP